MEANFLVREALVATLQEFGDAVASTSHVFSIGVWFFHASVVLV